MKVIVDTDAGSNDAVALFLLLAVPEVDVVAITCGYRHTEELRVVKDVLKILATVDRLDVSLLHIMRIERPLFKYLRRSRAKTTRLIFLRN